MQREKCSEPLPINSLPPMPEDSCPAPEATIHLGPWQRQRQLLNVRPALPQHAHPPPWGTHPGSTLADHCGIAHHVWDTGPGLFSLTSASEEEQLSGRHALGAPQPSSGPLAPAAHNPMAERAASLPTPPASSTLSGLLPHLKASISMPRNSGDAHPSPASDAAGHAGRDAAAPHHAEPHQPLRAARHSSSFRHRAGGDAGGAPELAPLSGGAGTSTAGLLLPELSSSLAALAGAAAAMGTWQPPAGTPQTAGPPGRPAARRSATTLDAATAPERPPRHLARIHSMPWRARDPQNAAAVPHFPLSPPAPRAPSQQPRALHVGLDGGGGGGGAGPTGVPLTCSDSALVAAAQAVLLRHGSSLDADCAHAPHLADTDDDEHFSFTLRLRRSSWGHLLSQVAGDGPCAGAGDEGRSDRLSHHASNLSAGTSLGSSALHLGAPGSTLVMSPPRQGQRGGGWSHAMAAALLQLPASGAAGARDLVARRCNSQLLLGQSAAVLRRMSTGIPAAAAAAGAGGHASCGPGSHDEAVPASGGRHEQRATLTPPPSPSARLATHAAALIPMEESGPRGARPMARSRSLCQPRAGRLTGLRGTMATVASATQAAAQAASAAHASPKLQRVLERSVRYTGRRSSDLLGPGADAHALGPGPHQGHLPQGGGSLRSGGSLQQHDLLAHLKHAAALSLRSTRQAEALVAEEAVEEEGEGEGGGERGGGVAGDVAKGLAGPGTWPGAGVPLAPPALALPATPRRAAVVGPADLPPCEGPCSCGTPCGTPTRRREEAVGARLLARQQHGIPSSGSGASDDHEQHGEGEEEVGAL